MDERNRSFEFAPMGTPPTDAPMNVHIGGPNMERGAAAATSQAVGTQAPGDDPVTGVMNLAAFGHAFSQVISASLAKVALWYIDIRSFRSINPKYGYLVGNKVLTCVAEGIKRRLAGDLPITRLGGDRFVFVSSGLDYPEADKRYHQLAEDVNKEIAKMGITNRIALIGGIYYLRDFDFERRDFKRALDYASIAHRNARVNPNSTLVLFTDEDLERDMRRIVIEQSFDQALEEGHLEVWFQPQVDYSYGEIVGAEALARWNHPDLGLISPEEFIPVLERCGKVHELDLFMWEESCRSASRWRSMADGKPVPISVNISRTELFEPGIVDLLKGMLKLYDLPDDSLHVEVTEGAFAEGADRLFSIIGEMRSNGMVVEMDDFGSGLSSLNMLKDVPVDVVKLDMGFVNAGVNEKRGGIVLSSVIRMLQGLETPIIAEGVETLEQAEMLKNMGCHIMQGYHFSPPMPVEEFESFVGSNTTLERSERRERIDSHLGDLMSFDRASSFLFNEAIGGTVFFFVRSGQVESILVNDRFYKECGLDRKAFGDRKINPIEEVDEESQKALWRAAAEAREHGSAMATAKVLVSGCWIEGCMRFIGDSNRGLIFSYNIFRSGNLVDGQRHLEQLAQDAGWKMSMLDKIAPSGFVKCRLDENLTLDYASSDLIAGLGFSYDEFRRRFHNTFFEVIAVHDRAKVMRAVQELMRPDDTIDCDVNLYQGFGKQMRATLSGRLAEDITGDRLLYLLIILRGEAEDDSSEEEEVLFDRVIPFDYHMDEDLLVIHASLPDGTVRDIKFENWWKKLDTLPDNIDPASAAKVLAAVRDLRNHPLSGFTDLKCNLRGGNTGLRWYHINYTCDANEDGKTTVIRGIAHDANDEMGSARWWRRQAEICQLTGLLNRHAVEQKINLLMRRHGGGMMLMIDLDDFKHVNDELGHLVGDDLLREVGKVLSDRFRESDALGRYGGDEFVAFMPMPASGDPRDLALRRANSIVEAISAITTPDGAGAACSIGVAITTNRDLSFYDLLEVADQALYESKSAGKSAVTIRDI